jgi:excisionase family DNA binding protein
MRVMTDHQAGQRTDANGPVHPISGGRTQLLTADELAARWQVPKSHVYRLTREGRIPTVRLGRYYRYRLAAVEAWERQSEAPVVAAA